MILTDSIKEQINDLFQANQHAGVHSVGLGYKFKNGQRTDEIGIVFNVSEKKSESDLPKDHILPSSLVVDGSLVKTDVIQSKPLNFAYCYSDGDPEVERLRIFATTPVALKGGMQIQEFPSGWYKYLGDSGGLFASWQSGTLGFFAKDNENGKIVGVTNRHVSVGFALRDVATGGLTGSGNTAVCNLPNHGYSNGQSVTILGASPSYYRGSFNINVIDANNFSYTTTSTITISPATSPADTPIQIGSQGGLIGSQRNVPLETLMPNNTIEQSRWSIDNNLYNPKASISNNASNPFSQVTTAFERINRYTPLFNSPAINYVDGCLLIPNSQYIDNDSYQMWQPTTQTTYPTSMPFATTAEIDNLLATNGANLGRVYSTGRSTGPKGWGSGDCRLHISQVGWTGTVGGPYTFSDQIICQTANNTAPIAGGDSGSCVTADINGTIKIIGVFFASGGTIGALNRIDRFANELNISAFTTPIDTSLPTPSLKSMDLTTYGSSTTIQSGGKTYYQVGLTNNTYP
jgi:hypothetical protein